MPAPKVSIRVVGRSAETSNSSGAANVRGSRLAVKAQIISTVSLGNLTPS